MLKMARLSAVALTLLTTIAWSASEFWGFCYAGRFTFACLTDGHLVLPVRFFAPPNCPEWGFWIQSPWRDEFPYYFRTWYGSYAPSFAAPTVLIPLLPVCAAPWFVILLRWLLSRSADQREGLKWIGTIGWSCLWFGGLGAGPPWSDLAVGSVAIIGPAAVAFVAIDALRRPPVQDKLGERALRFAQIVIFLLSALVLFALLGSAGFAAPIAIAISAVAIFLAPTLARRALERWTFVPVGHCRSCRYDLTGNVSGICPECGTRIDPAWLKPASSSSC